MLGGSKGGQLYNSQESVNRRDEMISPEQDYYAWTQETVEKLRQGRLAEVNMEDLIEELEDMGKSEKRALESRLSVLMGHLLKWQYQSDGRSYSWQGTINGQRVRIKKLLRDNPSLHSQLSEFIARWL
jgi:hypothetical protein